MVCASKKYNAVKQPILPNAYSLSRCVELFGWVTWGHTCMKVGVWPLPVEGKFALKFSQVVVNAVERYTFAHVILYLSACVTVLNHLTPNGVALKFVPTALSGLSRWDKCECVVQKYLKKEPCGCTTAFTMLAMHFHRKWRLICEKTKMSLVSIARFLCLH